MRLLNFIIGLFLTKDYPFIEGDDYYTIEESINKEFLAVVWSCWDEESELMHDKNPHKRYFCTETEAVNELNRINSGISSI